MKKIAAFLTLIRASNLVFIVLTQFLFEYCIYQRIYGPSTPAQLQQFWLIVLASVFIAAAGNSINDYFDLNIDQINKPTKVVVNVAISRRWVIFFHLVLSMLGLFFTAYALPIQSYWYLVFANMMCIVLLWVYSTNFKKQLLIGNVLISLLTAWVLLILFFSKAPLQINNLLASGDKEIRFFRLTVLYASFAFIISQNHSYCVGVNGYQSICGSLAGGVNCRAYYFAVLCAAHGMVGKYSLLCGSDYCTTNLGVC